MELALRVHASLFNDLTDRYRHRLPLSLPADRFTLAGHSFETCTKFVFSARLGDLEAKLSSRG
jgi:hypothetical protein